MRWTTFYINKYLYTNRLFQLGLLSVWMNSAALHTVLARKKKQIHLDPEQDKALTEDKLKDSVAV